MILNILPNVHCFAEVAFPCHGYEAPRILYDHELVYVSGGKNNITVGKTSYAVDTGQGIIIPPATPHFSENPYDQPALRHCIHFDWYGTQPVPERIYQFLDVDPIKNTEVKYYEKPLTFRLTPELALLLDRVLSLLREQSRRETAVRYAFGEFLANIVAMKESQTKRKTNIDRLGISNDLKIYIDNNYQSEINYGKFCFQTGRSPSYLCANFKKATGLSPTEYLIAVRLFHARRLLKSTSLTIDEICGRVGIPDHNYFSRLFRKRYGQSPTAYRRS